LLLLDCREPNEHDFARIEGGVLIPMSELPERLGEFDEHRSRDIIVYCHHGVRSLRVVQWLRQCGIDRAQSLAGGIDQWSLEVDGTVPRY
jgi:rhodanese-related sulfurtransferase